MIKIQYTNLSDKTKGISYWNSLKNIQYSTIMVALLSEHDVTIFKIK
jgi:hypothetical protein